MYEPTGQSRTRHTDRRAATVAPFRRPSRGRSGIQHLALSLILFIATLSVSLGCQPNGPERLTHPAQLLDKQVPKAPAERIGERVDTPDACRLRIFWATWCEPCKRELPQLDDWLAAFTGPIDVELIATEPAIDAPKVREFLERHDIAYGTYLEGQPHLVTHGLRAVPTAFAVDSEGVVRGYREGALDQQILAELLEPLGSCGEPIE